MHTVMDVQVNVKHPLAFRSKPFNANGNVVDITESLGLVPFERKVGNRLSNLG